MNDTIRELLNVAAETLPIWRDAIVAALALFVIAMLLLAAAAYGLGDE